MARRLSWARVPQQSPRSLLVIGSVWFGVGVMYLVVAPAQAFLGSIWLAAGVLYLGFAAYRFRYLRRHPEEADPDVGLTWTANDGRRLTITSVDGDTVSCSRFDPQTGRTDAWVGNRRSFEALTRQPAFPDRP